MAIVSEETKKRVESMTDEEIDYEINLGRRSHFQRESFAWLQTVKNQRDKLTQKAEKEEHDAMMRAFHNVPLTQELEIMPDIELAGLQSKLPPDSPGKIIIENEWHRRKSSKVPNPTPEPTSTSAHKITAEKKNWQHSPLYYIAVGVIIFVLGAILVYLMRKHLGISL